jgi:hypothetical protein
VEALELAALQLRGLDGELEDPLLDDADLVPADLGGPSRRAVGVQRRPLTVHAHHGDDRRHEEEQKRGDADGDDRPRVDPVRLGPDDRGVLVLAHWWGS